MNQNEIMTGIRVGMGHIRNIQETVLNDLVRDLKLKGRVLTHEDTQTLTDLQVAGNILKKRIVAFYNHFADTDKEAVPVIDEEDEFI